MSKHRVVVTGMGAVTPVGLDLEETWSALVAGRSGVRPVTSFDASDFPTTIAAEVLGFDPQNYMDFKSARRTARFTQFAVACTQEAIKNAGLDLSREDRERVGMAMGTAIGGITIIEEQSVIFHEKGYRRVNPALIPLLLASSSACHLAIELGIKGPTTSPVAACATGVVAVGDALRLLQHGLADVVIAGGTEAAISPLGLSAFSRVGVLSSNNVEPERACRPFDAKRDGTVMGEGAAALILETLEHAERRGANIIAEVVGYGLSEDAYHIAAPDPSGKGAARAMSLAMADAGLAAEELHYIAPHGTRRRIGFPSAQTSRCWGTYLAPREPCPPPSRC
jgi:3-oxoacyl-[acyl-carrier-protein] synthase II